MGKMRPSVRRLRKRRIAEEKRRRREFFQSMSFYEVKTWRSRYIHWNSHGQWSSYVLELDQEYQRRLEMLDIERKKIDWREVGF